MNREHPALHVIFQNTNATPLPDEDRGLVSGVHTTTLTLARALAVGCLSGLDQSRTSIDVWDPAAGSGFAGFLLVDALESAGLQVRYRGQEINEESVSASQRRFHSASDAEIARGDTLAHDAFDQFEADLVIVDAPWGMKWSSSAAAVRSRRKAGEFSFGLPQQNDSAWLFVSLALEKLRPAAEGGGRVAALVAPGSLSVGGESAVVRQAILEAGLLESVTRLPEGLALNTQIPLYLITLTNRPTTGRKRDMVMIADLQAQFTTERARRSMPLSAFRELESGLRTGKPGPLNRSIHTRQFTRREAKLARTPSDGRRISWRLTTFNDTPIDASLLESRYGPDHGLSLDETTREIVDLDPSRIFGDGTRELLKDLDAKGWPARRLSGVLMREPEALKVPADEDREGQLFIPTSRVGKVSTQPSMTESGGRLLSVQLDAEQIHASFLAAWLNSEQGIASQRRANETSSTGAHVRALRSDASSLMRWADELVIPMPPRSAQLAIASADEQLRSFEAELSTRRASIWAAPETANDVVNKVAHAFDDSLSAWLDRLPYPIATALWAAETASSPSEKQLAYIHAWEAIVAFHATVLLSASRNTPGSGTEVEAAIRRTLHERHLGIERASFGTWVVIAEKTSSDLRRALETDDADEIARVRRAFADLGRAGIERLVSKDLVKKFKEVNTKRNRWLGHTGYISDDEKRAHIDSLVSDLRDLRQLLGDVWAQLVLVRAGSTNRERHGYVQDTEIALGTKSPFRRDTFSIGDSMVHGELYLVKDGSQTPLPLLQFVQLRAAPRDAQYTSYFYNRTEGGSVRLVSYQHGPEGEVQDDLENLRDDFGDLALK